MTIFENEFDPRRPGTELRRQLNPAATVPGDAEGAPQYTIDFRSSDQSLDRYQEVLTVAGWRLENYRKNPVVQNAHSYWSLADTIGRALITEVRGDHLFQRVQFAVEENPMAKLAYGLYRGGFLRAVSVGFIPVRWENGTAEAGYRRKYLEQELVEVSAVSIPANPNALALGLKAGVIERGDVRAAVEALRGCCGEGTHRTDQTDPTDRTDDRQTNFGGQGARSEELRTQWRLLAELVNETRALQRRS